MPKFDERVARQYRYELPPGFPLASPNSGIVHHLSGLNKYAQARTSWSAAVALIFTAFAFTARTGFTPLHSHIGLTPWSVFQDGSCRRAAFDNSHKWCSSLARWKNVHPANKCCQIAIT